MTFTRVLTPVLLQLTQRVLNLLQAQSLLQERHEGQLQGLEVVGQDPDQQLAQPSGVYASLQRLTLKVKYFLGFNCIIISVKVTMHLIRENI